jgi:hypothetical protein
MFKDAKPSIKEIKKGKGKKEKEESKTTDKKI